MSALKILSH